MRIQPKTLAVTAVLGFLVATNPLVSNAAATLTGKDIKNGTLTGKDVKNESLKGKDIKDLSLGGKDVLVRVATANISADASNNVTGQRNLATAAITAPARGYLVIEAGSDVYIDGAGTDITACGLTYNGAEIQSSERVQSLDTANGNGEEDCSTNATIPVAAGSYSVALWGGSDNVDTNFDETSLSVLFVPFGATGNAPTADDIAAFLNSNDPGPIRPHRNGR